MKKYLFLLLTICFTGVAAFAQSDVSDVDAVADGPTITVVGEETHNFGDLIEGPKATHQFQIKNDGTDNLILTNVKASCGCTTPYWPKEPIAPGEIANIDVEYNTKGRIGAFTKVITITSNATTPTKQLYIKGKVVKADETEGMPEKKKSIVNE